jgi:uncharacterized protein YcfL
MRKLLVIALAVVALAGCKSNCRQLSEKLCDCTISSTAKSTCLTNVANHEASAISTAETEATCGALLDGCDCRLVDTPAGKVKCGLARPFGLVDAGD